MQPSELSLAGKLDIGLTKGLCMLCSGAISSLIWLLGIVQLVTQFSGIFEYGEGLSDLSWGEWGFMPLFVLLLWRHRVYCRHFGWGLWRGLSRLLAFQGRVLGIGLLILGAGWLWGKPSELVRTDMDPIMQLVRFGLALLTLYLAAPTRQAHPRSPTVEKDVTA
ncbi:hypothetical protein ACI77F_23465 [Pseudomonas tritici]|uniref:hypothetical protein n=1 Tax=Pseudomonas tritici TaxID=2745518 RepID=UPI00387B55C2